MITVKNLTTGEIIKNGKISVKGGEIIGDYVFGKRFFNKYGVAFSLAEERDGHSILSLNEGWGILKASKIKDATPATPEPTEYETQPTEAPAQPEQPAQPEPDFADAIEVVDEPEPAQPQPQTTPAGSDIAAAFAALTPLFSGVEANVKAACMAALQPIIDQMQSDIAKKAKKIVVQTTDGAEHHVDGITCEQYAEMLQDVEDGFIPYMVGAAGCGKSHTAAQIAEGLGLDFYPMQQLLFAHQVEGYGNAAGEYVPTPFYEAFKNGGLVFFDEFDGSAPEAAIVINAALANGVYTFPVVGTVKAHPNFRVIAAGNTMGTGADMEYTGRFQLDASSRDRVVYYEMTYDSRVELPIMAGGDEALHSFVVALREAIQKCGISCVVSYRATRYLHAREGKKTTAIRRGVLKGMNSDDVRILQKAMAERSDMADNEWAVAFQMC